MPIEIRELIISANVGSKGHKKGGLRKPSGKHSEATVEMAVDEVMRMLKKKKER